MYHGTYNVTIILRYIESLGQNENLSIKQLSEKTAFLVAFATLSRYCRLHPSLLSSPHFYFFMFLIPHDRFLLRVSSLAVLGDRVHYGADGATVDLVGLEKVTLDYTNSGYCHYLIINRYSWVSLTRLSAVVFSKSTLKNLLTDIFYFYEELISE